MTVIKRAATESLSQGQSVSGSDLQKPSEFPASMMVKKVSERDNCSASDRFLYGKLKVCGGELEADQESNGSSTEDMESPRSVVAPKVRKWPTSSKNNVSVYVHNQILRIREEDSHLGLDLDRLVHVDVMVFSRPASPLSSSKNKQTTTSIKTDH